MTPEEQFWQWFGEHNLEIAAAQSGAEPIFAALAQALEQVHPDLTFEIGVHSDGRREFVINADGVKAAFPAVILLVQSAPPLPGWTIVAFRQPKSQPQINRLGELRLSTDDIWYSTGRDGQQVGVTLDIRGLTPDNEDEFGQASFILLDTVLGEYDVETRLGFVERQPLPATPDSTGLEPLATLREALHPS